MKVTCCGEAREFFPNGWPARAVECPRCLRRYIAIRRSNGEYDIEVQKPSTDELALHSLGKAKHP